MKSGFDIMLHYASWLVNCLYHFICTANLFKISTTVSYGSYHHAKHKIMIIKPILNFAASKPKLRHLARITHMYVFMECNIAAFFLLKATQSAVGFLKFNSIWDQTGWAWCYIWTKKMFEVFINVPNVHVMFFYPLLYISVFLCTTNELR